MLKSPQREVSRWEWAVERLAFTLMFVAVWLGLNAPPLRWIGIGLFGVSIALDFRTISPHATPPPLVETRPTSRRQRIVAWLGRHRRNWAFRSVVVLSIGTTVVFDLGWWPYRVISLVIVAAALGGEIWLGPPPRAQDDA